MVLNKYKYQGRTNHTMLDVWLLTVRDSQYVSWLHVAKAWFFFAAILTLIVVLKFL